MLGQLNTVPLRQIWKNEAYDFTPWLAQHIDALGAALGLELEFEDTEVSVGPYFADILAKDTGTGQYVIIENQLEKTNHDHLGKCITYAAVLNASAIVWLASDFTEEHKKALDWLNDHTSDDIAFYGVKVELWQIDASKPAVKFDVKSSPNEIVRQLARRVDQGELSDSKKVQLDFWTQFSERLKASGKFRSVQKARAQYWFDIALGKSGVHLSNTFNTNEQRIGVRVYISNREAGEWLPFFEQHKEDIEKRIGEALSWQSNPNNRDKVITLNKHYDLTSPTSWPDALDWLFDKTLAFHSTFSTLVKAKQQSDRP